MEIKLTNKQAMHMADSILSSNFFIVGYGHFNISKEEFAQLLINAFDRNRYKKCSDLYKRLHKKYME